MQACVSRCRKLNRDPILEMGSKVTNTGDIIIVL
jgi:hypothetical protein